jgi:tetratricopeptide (TPR) repeat protein
LVKRIGGMLEQDHITEAVDFARRLEGHQPSSNHLRQYSGLMRGLGERYASSTPFQEYLLELFNSTNRETDYCATLARLFELYYADGNYLRAGECLDRAAEVDPYEAGHKRRLEMLRGKLDHNRFAVIANRLSSAVSVEEHSVLVRQDDPEHEESTTLEDLLLQAEIFLQYSLRARAAEKLRQLRKLFPDEELKNPKLRQLCSEAGIELAPLAPASAAGSAGPAWSF